MRSGADESKPHGLIYSIARLYNVQVEQYVKGDGKSTLPVLIPESLLTPEITRTPDAYKIGQAEYGNTLPRADVRYLLFLRSYVLDGATYYGGLVLPWRFVISQDDMVSPERALASGQWIGIEQRFPPKSLQSMIDQIRTAGTQ
jgi:hypothetical protein